MSKFLETLFAFTRFEHFPKYHTAIKTFTLQSTHHRTNVLQLLRAQKTSNQNSRKYCSLFPVTLVLHGTEKKEQISSL